MSGAVEQLGRDIRRFVPDGFRDDDGVWYEGPLRRDALAALAALTAERDRLREALELIAEKSQNWEGDYAAGILSHDSAALNPTEQA